MSLVKLNNSYNDIISIENLLEAWQEFICGKKNRKDTQEFQRNLMANIISLHDDLKRKVYKHSPYEAFNISDPKPRNIHKASVRDRLLHHAIYRILYPYFDKRFIQDSYSCRIGKGTHSAIQRFKKYTVRANKNHTATLWILKCDVRKFFASIDQEILLRILSKYILDKDILYLLQTVIESFHSTETGKGLPLGNLTSQLLVNIYMNEFDQFIKHEVKAKYYIRYADDFVVMSTDKKWLKFILGRVDDFLREKLKLLLHPDKVFIKTFTSGIDFLGWVHFPKHTVLRTVTKKRVLARLKTNQKQETIASYLGLISHGDTYEIRDAIEQIIPHDI